MEIVVEIADGKIEGLRKISERGGDYYSFQGIPYAKPPTGEFRFKEPRPVEPWTGIKSAKKEGPSCPYRDMRTARFYENSSEDCLFINVYTPSLPDESSTLKPVMFWIHGGGFQMGSSDTAIYGPDFLITEGVVLVTLNYRLGALGFLSLENELCPGNNGLKDIVLGLKWVQRNIKCFNGDPNNVTIFGESAGGVLVSYLLLSKASQGLYHKAISMSGTVSNPWALSEKPRELAYKLAELIGCPSNNDEELMKNLREASPKEMAMKGCQILALVEPLERYNLWLPFRPVVEPDLPGAFLTGNPRDLADKGAVPDIPLMFGSDNLDGLIIRIDPAPKEIKTHEEFCEIISKGLNRLPGADYPKETVKQLQKFYFPHGYNLLKHIDLLSYVFFEKGVDDNVAVIRKDKSRKSPTYLYRFVYSGGRNIFKEQTEHIDLEGASHGDEIGYLFRSSKYYKPLTPCTKDFETIETITKAWTDFAILADPWPTNKRKADGNNYIKISNVMTFQRDYVTEQRKFWQGLKLE